MCRKSQDISSGMRKIGAGAREFGPEIARAKRFFSVRWWAKGRGVLGKGFGWAPDNLLQAFCFERVSW